MTGGFVIAETEFSGGKIMDVRAGLGVGFGFDGFGDGMAVGIDEGMAVGAGAGVKVGIGVGTLTETPLLQINFLPDLIQVNRLP